MLAQMCRYLRNITIPAAFVTKTTGDALKGLTKKTSTGQGQEEVIVVMDWIDALPRADMVEWEFWTNSNDQCGAVCDVQKEFIKVCLGQSRPSHAANLHLMWLTCQLSACPQQLLYVSSQRHLEMSRIAASISLKTLKSVRHIMSCNLWHVLLVANWCRPVL